MSPENMSGLCELETGCSSARATTYQTLLDQLSEYTSPSVLYEQMYLSSQRELTERFEADHRLEDEFFRCRQLSISDFDGTKTIESSREVLDSKYPTTDYCIDDTFEPPDDSSTIHEAGTPATPGIRTGSVLRARNVPCAVKCPACFEEEESIGDDQSYMMPEVLERIIGPQYTFDHVAQVKSAGPTQAPLILDGDRIVKARISSISGHICDASLKVAADDNASDEYTCRVAPLNLDASPASLHFFSQAGVHVTTRQLQDDFVAAQNTALAGGCLDVDLTAEEEKCWATSEFFAASIVRTTRSSQGSLGFGEPDDKFQALLRCRKGVHDSEAIRQLLPVNIDDLADEDYYLSRYAEAPRNIPGHISTGLAIHTVRPPIDNVRHETPVHLKIDSFSDTCTDEDYVLPSTTCVQIPHFVPSMLRNMLNVSINSKQARTKYEELSVSQETPHTDYTPPLARTKDVPRPKSRQFSGVKRKIPKNGNSCSQSSKRARLAHGQKHSIQIDNDPAGQHLSPTSSSDKLSLRSPMATALRGYVGQFDIIGSKKLSRGKALSMKHTFGDTTHANGRITNVAFMPDIRRYTADLYESDISENFQLAAICKHAEQQCRNAARLQSIRSKEENALRREAHRECTAARLEGVPVGFYRYYLGHMTVEEYIEAKLCVCWEQCFCNKLCTRFGDLACPCYGYLVVQDEI